MESYASTCQLFNDRELFKHLQEMFFWPSLDGIKLCSRPSKIVQHLQTTQAKTLPQFLFIKAHNRISSIVLLRKKILKQIQEGLSHSLHTGDDARL